MKKILLSLILILFASNSFALFGKETKTVAKVTPAPVIKFTPIYLTAQQQKLANTSNYYTLDLNYPVIANNQPHAEQFNIFLMAQINRIVEQFQSDLPPPAELQNLAEQSQPLNANSNFLQVNYAILNKSKGIISVRLEVITYFYQAAHPNEDFITFNYDLVSGKEIVLANLFKAKTKYLTAIANYCQKKLMLTDAYQQQLTDASWIKSGAEAKLANYKNWNLQTQAILISFPPYQVAAYAAGPQNISVPLALLKKLIDPKSPAARFVK